MEFIVYKYTNLVIVYLKHIGFIGTIKSMSVSFDLFD